MAQVVQDAQLQSRIEHFIVYLLAKWASIPALAAEWAEWDEDSKLSFVHDWGVPEDRLYQLQQWAAQGALTPAQRSRYAELTELVARHRPTLEWLLEH